MEPTQEPRTFLRPGSFPDPPLQMLPEHSLFFGPFGLRAGWGIALYLLILILLGAGAAEVGNAIREHRNASIKAANVSGTETGATREKNSTGMAPGMVIVSDGLTFAGLFGVAWLFHKSERRPLQAYGLGSNRVLDIVPGGVCGVVLLSVVVAVLRARRLLIFEGQNLHGPEILRWGALWLLAFLLVGFAEEYMFRGYIQYTLMRGFWGLGEALSAAKTRVIAFWSAAIFWSAAFAAVHIGNSGENAFGIFQVFVAGMVFSYALWRTGSLWWGIGFHCTWDWAQSFLFGVADSGNLAVGRLFTTHPEGNALLSGGTTGPEGSIFATGALILAVLVIRFTTRPGVQPAIQQENIQTERESSAVPA